MLTTDHTPTDDRIFEKEVSYTYNYLKITYFEAPSAGLISTLIFLHIDFHLTEVTNRDAFRKFFRSFRRIARSFMKQRVS